MLNSFINKYIKTLVVFVSLSVMGCASAKIDLSQNEIEALRITNVLVSFSPNAQIRWDEAAGNYVRNVKGVKRPQGGGGRARDDNPEYQAQLSTYLSALRSPATKQYVRNALANKVNGVTKNAVAGWPNGTRSVTLKVVINSASEASAAVQILVGPTNSTLFADVTIVDPATGAVFGKKTRLAGISGESGGLLGVAITGLRSPKMDRVVADFAANVKKWLGAK